MFTFLLFCYIFSFYILVFPASMLIAAPLFLCVCVNKTWLFSFLRIWGTNFIRRAFIFQIFLIGFSGIFPVIYRTADFSFMKLMITQMVHFVCAIFFFTYIDVKNIGFDKVVKSFILIFVIQTFIELIATSFPSSIGKFVRLFNHFDPESVIGLGDRVRGYALSAATTYHLSLVYGVAFILYIKTLVESKKIRFRQLITGLLIVVGVFFAGRTGFVGIGIGCIYFLISLKVKTRNKFSAIIKLLVSMVIIISLTLTVAPKKFKDMVVDYLIPYAFEFVYQKLDSGKTQTASTNELKEMWHRDFDERELIFGSGKYTTDEGRYYMHVDPGILRHLLYGGILFYLLLVFYQMLITFPLKKRADYYIFILIFIYFLFMDFKGVTVGMNKFAFSSTLLLGFSYTRTNSDINEPQYLKQTGGGYNSRVVLQNCYAEVSYEIAA